MDGPQKRRLAGAVREVPRGVADLNGIPRSLHEGLYLVDDQVRTSDERVGIADTSRTDRAFSELLAFLNSAPHVDALPNG